MNDMSFDRLHQDLADLADEATAVDLRDRAIATSRKIGVRRAMGVSAVVAAGVAISAGTAFAMLPQRHAVSPAGPSPSAVVTSVEPSATPTSTPSSPVPPSTPNTSTPTTTTYTVAPLVEDPRTKKIVDGAIDMPAWPGLASVCPSGVAHFSHGIATASKAADNPTTFNLFYETPKPVVGMPGRVIYANLDGQSADEALITVMCSGDGSLDAEELLAVRIMPNDTIRTLGFVIATPDHNIFDYDSLTVEVQGREVQVEVQGDHQSNGGPLDAKQVRGYRFENGAFKQVSGPTTFPAQPTDIHNVDLRNTTIGFPLTNCGNGCVEYGSVRMHGGSGVQPYIVKAAGGTYFLTSVTFTIQHTLIIKDRGGISTALIWVRESGPGAETSAAVYDIDTSAGRGSAAATLVTSVGQDGITGIVKLSGSINLATVTVKTATGEHVFNYSQNAKMVWTKVS